MKWLILGLIWALPLLVIKGIDDPWNEPKELLWLAGTWLIILRGLFQNQIILRFWPERWAGWVASWVLIVGLMRFSWPFLMREPDATQGVYAIHHWIPTIYVLTAMLGIRVLSSWMHNSGHLAWVTKALCLSALLIGIYALAQGFGIEEFFRANYNVASPSKPMGVAFGNAGTTAMYLAILLPLFFLLQGWRWMLAGALLLVIILWLPGRSAWVVAASGLGTYAWCRLWMQPRARSFRLLLVGGLLVSVLGGGWYCLHQVRADERLPVWQETLSQWRTSPHPWTGMGLQAFPDRFIGQRHLLSAEAQVAMRSARWTTPMNEWLQALYELGLIGVLLQGLWAVALLGLGWRMSHTPIGAGWLAMGVALLVCSIVFFPWHYAPLTWLGMLTVAVVVRPTEGVL